VLAVSTDRDGPPNRFHSISDDDDRQPYSAKKYVGKRPILTEMSEIPPRIRPPDREQVRDLAERHYMDLNEAELEQFTERISRTLSGLRPLDRRPEPDASPPDARRQGYRPDESEDPLNAFVTRCNVSRTSKGPLSGYAIGLKDHIPVAGIEMTCGSRVMEGYVPGRDATIVDRILDAGGTIEGKLNMEGMSASGSGELSATGPVLNPRDPDHLTGGSSSGEAAAVVAGDVDIAIGGDQGGSIRRPAAGCGCVGLKPTFGLVPHTGVMGVAPTIDHVGPITRRVEDCAVALDVLAGVDPQDPRQCGLDLPEVDYQAALGMDPSDLTVGVLEEGFGWEAADKGVMKCVRHAIDGFEGAGVDARSASVPWHEEALSVWRGVIFGEAAAWASSEGVGHFFEGSYDTRFADAFARSRRAQADDFSPAYKLLVLTSEYLAEAYGSRYYAKAQNLRGELRAAYDKALADVDVLALPTTIRTELERREDLSLEELLDRGLPGLHENRGPFNVTGHPAVTVPCGTVDGLPIGLEFVGDRFADDAVLAAADAFERSVEWEENALET
jgi:amidase